MTNAELKCVLFSVVGSVHTVTHIVRWPSTTRMNDNSSAIIFNFPVFLTIIWVTHLSQWRFIFLVPVFAAYTEFCCMSCEQKPGFVFRKSGFRFRPEDLLFWRIKKPTRCHLIFYCTSYRLNMFQASLCPSSGARDYDVVYHIGHVVLGLLYVGGEV